MDFICLIQDAWHAQYRFRLFDSCIVSTGIVYQLNYLVRLDYYDQSFDYFIHHYSMYPTASTDSKFSNSMNYVALSYISFHFHIHFLGTAVYLLIMRHSSVLCSNDVFGSGSPSFQGQSMWNQLAKQTIHLLVNTKLCIVNITQTTLFWIKHN